MEEPVCCSLWGHKALDMSEQQPTTCVFSAWFLLVRKRPPAEFVFRIVEGQRPYSIPMLISKLHALLCLLERHKLLLLKTLNCLGEDDIF